MKKLVQGVIDFRKKVRPTMLGTFEKLALGQTPDVLLVTCSDSRVAVNVFASTDPGDLFVMRNVGNIIPPFHSGSSESFGTGAGLEFALQSLQVKHIIICGHSECGAMIAAHAGINTITLPSLKEWLRAGFDETLRAADHNTLSQMNVLKQIEHLKSYPEVAKRLALGGLKLHAWWFEIKNADIYAYDFEAKKFELMDEHFALKLIQELGEKTP